MNWRRGLLLAGIHLAVAGFLILSLEARDAKYLHAQEESVAEAAREAAARPAEPPNPAPAPVNSGEATETITFNMCSELWVHYPPQTIIVRLANYPAMFLTHWRMQCPSRWSLSGMLNVRNWRPSLESQRRADLGMILIIAIQWFLVGGFPLRKPLRWWEEPGSLITICTVASGLLVLIPNDRYDALPTGPMLIAGLAWFWWLGLLVWKCLRTGWRLMIHAKTMSLRRPDGTPE
jgi:hypothetical protein